jgi:hypothetical protein
MIEYEPIGWVNGEEAETTPLNADNLNHMDEGIQAATNYLSETRDIADDTAERLALQIARLDVIVANMSTNTRTLTQAEYDSLTEAEKNNNTIYFISDGGMNDTTKAASIEYDKDRSGLTGETVQAAIDENASAVAALNNSAAKCYAINLGSVGNTDKTISGESWQTIFTSSNVQLETGTYAFISAFNAKWTVSGYQFFPGVKIGSTVASSLTNYAAAQDSLAFCVGYITVASGTYTVSLVGRTTGTNKIVTVPGYQASGILLIKMSS